VRAIISCEADRGLPVIFRMTRQWNFAKTGFREVESTVERMVGKPGIGSELKTPCASTVFDPHPQRGYSASFMRAGNSSFSLYPFVTVQSND
jgi:hypothetical protein